MRNDIVTGLMGFCLLSSTLLAADGHSVTANPAPKAEAMKSVRLVGACDTSYSPGHYFSYSKILLNAS